MTARRYTLPLSILLGSIIAAVSTADESDLKPKPVPRLQVLPRPYDQASFQLAGRELTRYHFGKSLRRPFLFPIVGPSGRPLTRMSHPHDPEGHSHHNSVWISHNAVDGISFWNDRGKGRIAHERVARYEDGDGEAAALLVNRWTDDGGKTLLREVRRVALRPLEGGEWLLVLDLLLEPGAEKTTLGKTPFGIIGVRVAKTIGVHDGGGRILNSEGAVNEKGVFWKPARWVDYSGAITRDAREGLTLLDHPSNPNHPTVFHVRDDGWMGASLTFDADRTIERGKPLRLRYGLYVHAGVPKRDALEKRWKEFAALPMAELTISK